MQPRRTAALLISALLAAIVGCDAVGERPAPLRAADASPAPAEEPVVEVRTARIRRGPILQRISAPGSLVAHRESRIGPEVRGRITKIFVEEGERVEEGAPLFEIEREPYELALRQARARLDRLSAERKQIEVDLRRGRRLRERDVLSETEMEQLATSVEVAKAAEREAEEALALAERDLEQTLARAPYSASVVARLADEGTTALVQPQTVVVVLQETAQLEARARIPELHFKRVRTGDPALLHVEGLPQPIPTEVAAVSDSIDPATRTFLVRMFVDNQDHLLKAGGFARVEILPRATGDVLIAPREAIRSEDGRSNVLAVEDGRAVLRPVRVGIVGEDVVEILSGLRVDERVVVGDAAATLGPGMRVRVAAAAS